MKSIFPNLRNRSGQAAGCKGKREWQRLCVWWTRLIRRPEGVGRILASYSMSGFGSFKPRDVLEVHDSRCFFCQLLVGTVRVPYLLHPPSAITHYTKGKAQSTAVSGSLNLRGCVQKIAFSRDIFPCEFRSSVPPHKNKFPSEYRSQ
jgi:hypothetical protein